MGNIPNNTEDLLNRTITIIFNPKLRQKCHYFNGWNSSDYSTAQKILLSLTIF